MLSRLCVLGEMGHNASFRPTIIFFVSCLVSILSLSSSLGHKTSHLWDNVLLGCHCLQCCPGCSLSSAQVFFGPPGRQLEESALAAEGLVALVEVVELTVGKVEPGMIGLLLICMEVVSGHHVAGPP